METYMHFSSWTDQGIRDTRNSVDRATAAVDEMERFGVKIFEMFWTVGGPHDLIMVADCPDQETAQAVALRLGARGNIRPLAVRAFDRGEMAAIVEKLEARPA